MPDWTQRLRCAFEANGHACDADVLDELSTHAAAAYDALRADGSNAHEAERRVDDLITIWVRNGAALRRRPKGASAIPPPSADRAPFAGLLQDLRYGIRLLRRQPRFAAVAMLTMALGIGATTALFSVTYGVLLKPLPWPDSDRLVRVTERRTGHEPRVRGTMSNGPYHTWTASHSTIEAIGGWLRQESSTIAMADGEPTAVATSAVTPSLFTGIRVLLALSPGNIPRIGPDGSNVVLDSRVLGFALALSILTPILFGLVPALSSSRADLSTTLKEGGNRTGTGWRQSQTRVVLVTAEMALAVVLLIAAALLIRTFAAVRHVNPGFDARNVLTMRMLVAGPRFETAAGMTQALQEGVRRIRALPGVEVAATSCCVPLVDRFFGSFRIAGRPEGVTSLVPSGWTVVSPGYFETFNIPVVRGRTFTDRDDSGPRTVVINQALARRVWPNSDPTKDRVIIGDGEPRQIIGVVKDVRDAVTAAPGPNIYTLSAHLDDKAVSLMLPTSPWAWLIRTRVAPRSLSSVIQGELRQASGGLPVARITTMDEILSQATARENFNMSVLTVFGFAALLLAAVGIYGLMACSVAQRIDEIAVRLALGAEPSQIRNMVVIQGLRPVAVGTVCGVAAAFGLTRLIMQVAIPRLGTVVVAGALAWPAIGQLGAAPAQPLLRITLPDDQHFAPTGRQLLTVSPNGRDVVYVANGRLYRRGTSERQSMAIPGIEIPQGILNPVFSPDGQSIAFWSGADQTLKRIPVRGGAPVTICQTAPPFGISWASTDDILFGAGPKGVMRVPASGGVAETLIAVSNGTLAAAPQLLPGGDAVLFTILTPPPPGVIGINPFEHGEIAVQSIRTGERMTVLKPADEAHYASSGYLLYGLAGKVFAAAFDLKGLVVTGEAKPIVDDVRTAGPTQFALSGSGALAFIPGRQGSVQLELLDRSGRRKAPGTLPDSVFALRVSPSGRQVTFDTFDGVVWIADLDHLSLKHALTSGGNNRFPMWSGDGQRIFYTSEREGAERLFSQNVNGTSSGELLTQPVRSAESWSPQHQMLSFITFKAGGDYDIWGYSVPDKKVVPLVEIPGSAQHSSRFSPDGRWLAYASNETGRWEVFVQSFPITGTRFQITTDGGGHPLWSPDSKEIFIDRAGRMFSIRVRTEPTFAADPPVPLPISGFIQGEARRQYDMTPDGKQFLMMFPAVSQFAVAANWAPLLKRASR